MSKIQKFAHFLAENIGMYQNPGNITAQTDPYAEQKAAKMQQYARLQGILMNVFAGQSNFMDKRDELNFQVDNLVVKRIFRNGSGSLDVHIRFESNELPFHGAFYNWGSLNGATFKSEYMDVKRFHRENRVRFEGILVNALTAWFKPQEGTYTCLRDTTLINDMGEQVTVPVNASIQVEEVLTEENKPTIYLTYLAQPLYLTDLEFYYFHWWFEGTPKKKFYF